MKPKIFSRIAGIIFFVVATLHLIRAVAQWPVFIANWPLPFGVSIAAAVVLYFLAFTGIKNSL